MILSEHIIRLIKASVHKAEPGADIILFGSYARGDHRKDSDVDLLILSDKQKISDSDKQHIIYDLYDIELSSGYPISSVILSKTDWNSRYLNTPFYQNIKEDGILL